MIRILLFLTASSFLLANAFVSHSSLKREASQKKIFHALEIRKEIFKGSEMAHIQQLAQKAGFELIFNVSDYTLSIPVTDPDECKYIAHSLSHNSDRLVVSNLSANVDSTINSLCENPNATTVLVQNAYL